MSVVMLGQAVWLGGRGKRGRRDAWRKVTAVPAPTRSGHHRPDNPRKDPAGGVEPGARDATVAPRPSQEQETMIKTMGL